MEISLMVSIQLFLLAISAACLIIAGIGSVTWAKNA